MKMNCVFFSDGIQREMVREVGGGGVERGRGIYKCATNVLEMKITWDLNWCKSRRKFCQKVSVGLTVRKRPNNLSVRRKN